VIRATATVRFQVLGSVIVPLIESIRIPRGPDEVTTIMREPVRSETEKSTLRSLRAMMIAKATTTPMICIMGKYPRLLSKRVAPYK